MLKREASLRFAGHVLCLAGSDRAVVYTENLFAKRGSTRAAAGDQAGV